MRRPASGKTRARNMLRQNNEISVSYVIAIVAAANWY
jgi:hypothetical protein